MVSVTPPPVMLAPPDAATGAADKANRLSTAPRLSADWRATRCLRLNAPATPTALSPFAIGKNPIAPRLSDEPHRTVLDRLSVGRLPSKLVVLTLSAV